MIEPTSIALDQALVLGHALARGTSPKTAALLIEQRNALLASVSNTSPAPFIGSEVLALIGDDSLSREGRRRLEEDLAYIAASLARTNEPAAIRVLLARDAVLRTALAVGRSPLRRKRETIQ